MSQSNRWEPDEREWDEWIAHKKIQRMGGPRVPINPLLLLITWVGGRTEVEEAVQLQSPENIRRSQAEQRRRAVRRRLAMSHDIPVLAAALRRVLARLPAPQSQRGQSGKPQRSSFHVRLAA